MEREAVRTGRYRATTDVPPLVEQTSALAERLEFTQSCWPEVGRLLAVLASSVRGGIIGETGTGCGVGAAWMASSLSPDTQLITIELDVERARAAREVLEPAPNVRVLQGDWHELLSHGPFDMLFVDGGSGKQQEQDAVLGALRPGGLVVLDDLWPQGMEPPELRGKPHPVREFWLNDPRLAATEILTGPRMAVILATRIG